MKFHGELPNGEQIILSKSINGTSRMISREFVFMLGTILLTNMKGKATEDER